MAEEAERAKREAEAKAKLAAEAEEKAKREAEEKKNQDMHALHPAPNPTTDEVLCLGDSSSSSCPDSADTNDAGKTMQTLRQSESKSASSLSRPDDDADYDADAKTTQIESKVTKSSSPTVAEENDAHC